MGGPSRSEPMSVEQKGHIIDPLAIIWRGGRVKSSGSSNQLKRGWTGGSTQERDEQCAASFVRPKTVFRFSHPDRDYIIFTESAKYSTDCMYGPQRGAASRGAPRNGRPEGSRKQKQVRSRSTDAKNKNGNRSRAGRKQSRLEDEHWPAPCAC